MIKRGFKLRETADKIEKTFDKMSSSFIGGYVKD